MSEQKKPMTLEEARKRVIEIGYFTREKAEAISDEIMEFIGKINEREGEKFDLCVGIGLVILSSSEGGGAAYPDGGLTSFNGNGVTIEKLAMECLLEAAKH